MKFMPNLVPEKQVWTCVTSCETRLIEIMLYLWFRKKNVKKCSIEEQQSNKEKPFAVISVLISNWFGFFMYRSLEMNSKCMTKRTLCCTQQVVYWEFRQFSLLFIVSLPVSFKSRHPIKLWFLYTSIIGITQPTLQTTYYSQWYISHQAPGFLLWLLRKWLLFGLVFFGIMVF